jgi:CDP-6-deoxy-D-xylo-4-hexulose-3-dehydrase
MISIRRKNLIYFNKLFKNHKKFIIQKTKYYNSSFSFPLILKEKSKSLKNKIFKILKRSKIEFRLITGGCFTEHDYSKHFNFKTQDKLLNAKHAHYYGFFVGNSSIDLKKQINSLHKVLENI